MDIETRKQRLNERADQAGCDRVVWHGEMGDTCGRCRVQVPAGFLLALPESDVAGCLRCLEMQAHLFYGDLANMPEDLANTGGQQDAMRLIAHEFRQYIKAAQRGREPLSRRASSSRWAARSGWEASDAWEPPGPSFDEPTDDGEVPSTNRWPKRPMRGAAKTKPTNVKAKSTKIRQPERRATAGAGKPQASPSDILGLTGEPSRGDIMAAFRRSALICHPDYGGSADAFRELVAARDALLEKC